MLLIIYLVSKISILQNIHISVDKALIESVCMCVIT